MATKNKKYEATAVLIHNGETVAVGEQVELTADQSKRLLDAEVIKEVGADAPAEPPKEDK